MIFVRLARREPGGAKGLLESMAAGNTQSYRPWMMKRKGKVNIVLHRSNGKAHLRSAKPVCIKARGPVHHLPAEADASQGLTELFHGEGNIQRAGDAPADGRDYDREFARRRDRN
jgi:hypothetical protein